MNSIHNSMVSPKYYFVKAHTSIQLDDNQNAIFAFSASTKKQNMSDGRLKTFIPVKGTVDALAVFIENGQAISPHVFESETRGKDDSSTGCFLIIIDKDQGKLTLEERLQDPFVQEYCALINTSKSHQKSKMNAQTRQKEVCDRWHEFYILPHKVDVDTWVSLSKALQMQFADNGLKADHCSYGIKFLVFGNCRDEDTIRFKQNAYLDEDTVARLRLFAESQQALETVADTQVQVSDEIIKSASSNGYGVYKNYSLLDFVKDEIDSYFFTKPLEAYEEFYPGFVIKERRSDSVGCTNPWSPSNSSETGSMAIFLDSGVFFLRGGSTTPSGKTRGTWFQFVEECSLGMSWLDRQQKLARKAGKTIPEHLINSYKAKLEGFFDLIERHLDGSDSLPDKDTAFMAMELMDLIHSEAQGDKHKELDLIHKAYDALLRKGATAEFAHKVYCQLGKLILPEEFNTKLEDPNSPKNQELMILATKTIDRALEAGDTDAEIRLALTGIATNFQDERKLMRLYEARKESYLEAKAALKAYRNKEVFFSKLGREFIDNSTIDYSKVLPKDFAQALKEIAAEKKGVPSLILLSFLSLLGGCIGNRVTVSAGSKEVLDCKNWLAVVAESGVGKSSAVISAGVKVIRLWQKKENEIYRQQLEDYQQLKANFDSEYTGTDLDPNYIPHPVKYTLYFNSGTDESFLWALANNTEYVRRTGNSRTKGFIYDTDEIVGMFKGRGQYAQQTKIQEILLKLFTQASTVESRRQEKDSYDIDYAYITILGGMTPGSVSQYLSADSTNGENARFNKFILPQVEAKMFTASDFYNADRDYDDFEADEENFDTYIPKNLLEQCLYRVLQWEDLHIHLRFDHRAAQKMAEWSNIVESIIQDSTHEGFRGFMRRAVEKCLRFMPILWTLDNYEHFDMLARRGEGVANVSLDMVEAAIYLTNQFIALAYKESHEINLDAAKLEALSIKRERLIQWFNQNSRNTITAGYWGSAVGGKKKPKQETLPELVEMANAFPDDFEMNEKMDILIWQKN